MLIAEHGLFNISDKLNLTFLELRIKTEAYISAIIPYLSAFSKTSCASICKVPFCFSFVFGFQNHGTIEQLIIVHSMKMVRNNAISCELVPKLQYKMNVTFTEHKLFFKLYFVLKNKLYKFF